MLKVQSEIGANLSRFAGVKHFFLRLALCPRTTVRGGKVLSARTQRSCTSYCPMCAYMDKFRANIAVAYKLTRVSYFMLTRGKSYMDKGQQHYQGQKRQLLLSSAAPPTTASRLHPAPR